MADPARLLASTSDFFGDALDRNTDTTLNALLKPPVDVERFSSMMQTVISATITVLERQYKVYFYLDVTEKLTSETRSARSHNMDAEEVMGLFSVLQKKSPHATIGVLSSKLRAQKNRTVDYLDREAPNRDALITRGQKLRQLRRVKQRDIQAEVSASQQSCRKKRQETARKGKNCWRPRAWKKCPTYITLKQQNEMTWHIFCKATSLDRTFATHGWTKEQGMVYNGRIEKFRRKTGIYRVGYWSQKETYADAVDYNMSMHELAELVFC